MLYCCLKNEYNNQGVGCILQNTYNVTISINMIRREIIENRIPIKYGDSIRKK